MPGLAFPFFCQVTLVVLYCGQIDKDCSVAHPFYSRYTRAEQVQDRVFLFFGFGQALTGPNSAVIL